MSESNSQIPLFLHGGVVDTLRYGPYANSAKALAEIVDNSYDADAKSIHVALICKKDGRTHTIAVLDDGKGMNEDALKRCLQYGYNKQNHETSRRPIGKFGVGLLAASLNQCRDLEVYSWTEGFDEKKVNSINFKVKEVKDFLPPITVKSLPDFFDYGFPSFDLENTNLNKHGTLVVWRDLDKITWKKAETVSRHLEKEIGRIYRNFLHSHSQEKIEIFINIVKQDQTKNNVDEKPVKPIDPLFLSHWPCHQLKQYLADLEIVKDDPQKYGVDSTRVNNALRKKSLFIPYSENKEDNATNEDETPVQFVYPVEENGKTIGSYRILASYRRPRVVRAASLAGIGDSRNPGNTKYGKLVEQLRGVSILRDGRELALDPNWLSADSTVDRWLSISLDFDRELDDLFGVSNDKQMAKSLSSLAQIKTYENIEEDYDSTAIEAAQKIHAIISAMRIRVRRNDAQRHIKPPDEKKPIDPVSEDINTQINISRRIHDGTDIVDGIDNVDPINGIRLTEQLKDTEHNGEDASVVRTKILVDNNIKYEIVSSSCFGNSDMFEASSNASGVMVIRLNTQHPLYQTLEEIIKADNDADEELEQSDENPQDLKERLSKAMTTIRQLIAAYFRAEFVLSASSDEKKDFSEDMRRKWSQIVRKLTEKEE